jgi:hypothetical protein
MRAVTDAALTTKLRAAHAASNGTYGAPRLQIDLAAFASVANVLPG